MWSGDVALWAMGQGVMVLHFKKWVGGANYANNYRDNWQMSIETENVQKTSWILKGLTCMLWGQITFHFFACQFWRLPPHILLLKLAPSTFRFSSKVCVSHHQFRRVGFPFTDSGPILALCVRLVIMSYGPCGYVQALAYTKTE